MQITEAYEERKGGEVTLLIIEGFEVNTFPCTVTVEIDDLNKRDKTMYMSIYDVDPISKEDKEYALEHSEDFDIDTDYNGIDNIVFNHFDL